MNCCDYKCDQGRNCPVRQCKGEDVTLFTQTQEEIEAELQEQWRKDLRAIVFVASGLFSFFLIFMFSL